MTAEELAEKAKDQRRRGRLEEALISAQHATTLDPRNANAFWQLALCQLDLSGAAKALGSLERVTDLAPQFAYGWTQRGLALRKTGEDNLAAECFEEAVRIEPDQTAALVELATIYERGEQPDDEMRVLLALEELAELTLYQNNRLGILYHRKKDFYPAIRYYRLVAAEGSGPVGFFNLGLVFNEPEVGQRADAIDAWRRALGTEPEYDRASQMIAKLMPELSVLQKSVTAQSGAVLDHDQWYSHYINPLELLRVDEGVEVEGIDAKSLQRAKKALLQEVELEDGRVEWMPGLRIDRSRAISICDELNNEPKLLYHFHVFQNKALSSFLQRGDLKHFLVDELTSPIGTISTLEDDPDGFGSWLSLRFAAQFDLALTKAVERQDIAAVRSLLDGRRWVRAEDEDKCFNGAHRQIERLLDPLRRAANQSEKTKPTLADVQSLLCEGSVAEILGLLPMVFHQERQEAATLVRSISVDAYNHHDDADLAKAILQLSHRLTLNSPSLQHRVKDDLAILDKRIEAERKDETHLVIGGLDCSISREGVRLGQKFIPTGNTRALRWGTIVTRSGGASSLGFRMAIGDLHGTEIKIEWTASKDLDAQRELFAKLANATLTYLVPRVFAVIRESLDNQQRVRIGNVVLTKEGVEFIVQGWFKSQTICCPWGRLRSTIKDGDVVIFDSKNDNAAANLALHEVDNAFVLHLLAQND